MAIINCGNTYSADVPGCIPAILINAGLTESTEYRIGFIWANGFKLQQAITTGEGGVIELTKDELLEGFWNEGAGNILLQVFETDSSEPKDLTICELPFKEINLNFQPIQTDATTFTIGVNCPE